ncbi:hypothetical protein [endosymbiont GvMRE of Glomus versiforme]|uniref:hypothetical protein n=1 Tax=endosymbiont GvMRE of Glomus versiforme TaxID=2039283 RepID=UPI000EE51EED|nr:hypothetical protein [endosymbiont GvMRE of Glomus versiforme]RHZ36463.1 hypothetical protein GvMRE_I2g465 [endosymbiont GvMRE of Glomus versiforme]
MAKTWFKLLDKEYSQIDREWQWTYLLLIPFTFNKQMIIKVTITDIEWKDTRDIAVREPKPKKKSRTNRRRF